MALRDQPYLPLYVQDLLTDEKLIECSAEAHGVYLRLLCLLHKADPYGTILLKQKYKQNASKSEANTQANFKLCFNFASQFEKSMPFSVDVIARGLSELLAEDVIQIDGDVLSQKRMVRDAELSEKRANAGKKGGSAKPSKNLLEQNTKQNVKQNASKSTSKSEANSENEIENENINETENNNKVSEKKVAKKKAKTPKEDVFLEFAKDDEKLLSKLRDFEDHRRQLGKAYKTPYERTRLVGKLKKFAGDDHALMIYLLDYAMDNCWMTVFEPKEYTRHNREPENTNIFREMLEEEQRKKGGGAGDP